MSGLYSQERKSHVIYIVIYISVNLALLMFSFLSTELGFFSLTVLLFLADRAKQVFNSYFNSFYCQFRFSATGTGAYMAPLTHKREFSADKRGT